MAGEPTRDGPEISRRIREELERIRDAEARVEEALETVRQARRRVEVVARELAREEERVRSWVREELKAAGGSGPVGPGSEADASASRTWRSDPALGWSTWRDGSGRTREGAGGPGSEPPEGALPEDRRPAAPDVERPMPSPPMPTTMPPSTPPAVPPTGAAQTPAASAPPPPIVAVEPATTAPWGRRIGLGVVVALAVALIGWFAIRGLQKDSVEKTAAVDTTAHAGPAQGAPAAPAPAVAPSAATGDSAKGAGPLAQLPTDASARQALYDSLFTARSPLFEPLLSTIQSESSDKGVQRALTDWKSGSVDAQDADLIHSAFLQHVLKGEVDPRIEVDGQVLRNPCRGRSCSALLNVWEHQQAKYGLPPVPDNAPTDPRALRQAEAAVVLSWLHDANAPGAPATGAN